MEHDKFIEKKNSLVFHNATYITSIDGLTSKLFQNKLASLNFKGMKSKVDETQTIQTF